MGKVNQSNSAACEIVDSMDQINSLDWNRVVPADYPFLRHEFLHALESSGCVSAQSGWAPQHIVIRNLASKHQEVIGAAPLYLKAHSWGEFIFDWDWAHGYQSHGLDYYPKLISQTPFTPITSPKMLTASAVADANIRRQMAKLAHKIASQNDASSIHWHFVSSVDSRILNRCDYLSRASTFEYIWSNQNYASMDDFLGTLASRKRKKIRRERKSVRDQGICICALHGAQLNESHWQLINWFYRQTVDKYHSHKYLSANFFRQIGQTMPDNIVLFLATLDRNPIAASFCLRGGSKLFGRYWGTLGKVPNLHFELCYYAAIEYCIQHNLVEYNAGVQGEHKLNRGFLPKPARSSHAFRHPAFSAAIDRYIDRESSYMQAYRETLNEYSPYAKQSNTLTR